ncbi:MAG: hypothetical protein Q4G65_18495, partial [bacterium]|nr:hypothetical protein [bacterium]
MQFKHTILLALFTIHSSLFTLPAAVPLRWTVETSRAQVAQFEAYRGETLLLEATMQSYGSPLATPARADIYWQTNGMGSAWWKAPATASGNVLKAYWSPTNDCGGTVYNCFIGGPDATYRAAFRLRMLPSPGFTPNHLPLPTVKAESDPVFSAWLATNEFSSAGVDTNAVLGLIAAATNAIPTVRHYTDLDRIPKIEGKEVSGDRPASYYGIATLGNLRADSSGINDRIDGIVAGLDEFYSYVDADLATKEELSVMQQTQVTPLQDEVDTLSGTVSAWQTYWDGDDVRVTVTNYYGNLDHQSLYLEQKMPADADHSASWFKTIWDE